MKKLLSGILALSMFVPCAAFPMNVSAKKCKKHAYYARFKQYDTKKHTRITYCKKCNHIKSSWNQSHQYKRGKYRLCRYRYGK